MNQQEILRLLEAVENQTMTSQEAMLRLRMQPFEDLGFAKPDFHRALRQGVSEVIYGAGKTPAQISAIVAAMRSRSDAPVLITRMDASAAEVVSVEHELHYHEHARVGIVGQLYEPYGSGTVVVATGGTSDMPVAEEAALTLEFMQNRVVRLYDVGVAGLHRLLAPENLEQIMCARVIVAIAGMEGALASVIGGLVDRPVIAVPTSIGYGASFHGLAALLAMLNSCASGVSVVNIDNGFGAGYMAGLINHLEEEK